MTISIFTPPPPAVRVLDITTTYLQRVNTAVEGDMYSVVVPGGTLTTRRFLRLGYIGGYTNATGAGQTITGRLYFGAQAFSFAFVPGSVGGRGNWNLFATILAENNTQVTAWGYSLLGGTGSFNTGTVNPFATIGPMAGGQFRLAADVTLAQTLRVTAQLAIASPNLSVERMGVTLELFRF